MPARVLDGGVAVDVGQQAQAEAVAIVGRVGEAVHQDAGGGRLEGLSDPVIQLVVHDGAPVLGFFVGHRLHICTQSDRHRGCHDVSYVTFIPQCWEIPHKPMTHKKAMEKIKCVVM